MSSLLDAPDEHLEPAVAEGYDEAVADRFAPDEVNPTVDRLVELADGGRAVEFAVGTGRIAIPLAARGVRVSGIDASEPMLGQMRAKPGADLVDVRVGDMTTTQLCDDASLVYLVFNTIMNLRTQEAQVACFRNAANHLGLGGCFVIETIVPRPGSAAAHVFDVSERHVGIDECVDPVEQISVSHHFTAEADGRYRKVAAAFRYVWPAELDLMAQLAGLQREDRWADWHRMPFTANSLSHVSIWRKR